MELLRQLDRFSPPNGKKPYYRGVFRCAQCGQEVIKSMSNGKIAKSCGSENCNPRRIYKKNSRSLKFKCEVCGDTYQQQKRLYEKATWKNRCPKHRFDVSNLTKEQIDKISKEGRRPKKYFTETAKREASRSNQYKYSLSEICVDCGSAVHKGSSRCRQCSNKKIFDKGKVNNCEDCGKEIHRQATRCKPCNDKLQDQGKSKERVKFQNSPAWAKIRIQCFERDHYLCQKCGISNQKLEEKMPDFNVKKKGAIILEAHHIKPYRNHPELRLKLSNLTTLCTNCHNAVHSAERGEVRWNTKLTDIQVHEVYKHLIERRGQAEIAKLYGVSQAVISNLNTGRARKEIFAIYESRLHQRSRKGAVSAKLTLVEAEKVRRDFAQGITRRQISVKFNISKSTVDRILRNETYIAT